MTPTHIFELVSDLAEHPSVFPSKRTQLLDALGSAFASLQFSNWVNSLDDPRRSKLVQPAPATTVSWQYADPRQPPEACRVPPLRFGQRG